MYWSVGVSVMERCEQEGNTHIALDAHSTSRGAVMG